MEVKKSLFNLANLKFIILIVLKWCCILCLCLCLCLFWLISTNSGLKFALLKIPVFFNSYVNVTNLKGSILKGFSGENWNIKFSNQYVFNIDFIKFVGGIKYKNGTFQINNIIFNNTNIQYNFTSNNKTEVNLPSSIGLPFNFKIHNIKFNLATLGEKQEILFENANIYYAFIDNKHMLNIKNLTTSWGNINGILNVANYKNFPINGNFKITPVYKLFNKSLTAMSIKEKEDIIDGYLYLSGNLKESIINLHINGNELSIDSNIIISLYEQNLKKIKYITFYADKFNPKTFINSAPIADLSFSFILLPDMETKNLNGEFLLKNHNANYIDRSGIPITNINCDFFINNNNQIIISKSQIILLKNGQLNITGKIDNDYNKLNLKSKVKITINDFLTYNLTKVYDGDILVSGSFHNTMLDFNLASQASKLQGNIVFKINKFNQKKLLINRIQLSYFESSILNIYGYIGLIDDTSFDISLLLKKFNPANISADFNNGNINGTLSIKGNYIDDIFAKLNIQNSILSNKPLKAIGEITVNNKILKKSNLDILLGENTLNINGNLGKKADKLLVNIKALNLSQIGFGLVGQFKTNGFISGKQDNFKVNFSGDVSNIGYKDILKLNKLNFNVKLSRQLDSPLNINIQGNNLKFQDYIAKRINLVSQGTLRKNNFFTDSDIKINNHQYIVKINCVGGFNDNYYNGQFLSLDISGNMNLKLQNKVKVLLGNDKIKINPAIWSFMGGKLDLESLSWEKDKFFISKGKATNINLSYLNNFLKIPLEQNLVVNSTWDFTYANNARGVLNIKRLSGDINFPKSKKKIGLSQLDLNILLNKDNIKSIFTAKSDYFLIDSNLNLTKVFGSNFKNSSILGDLHLKLEDIRKLKFLFPVDTIIGGKLNTDINFKGSLGNILLSGPIKAKDITYHSLDSGIFLQDGVLDAHFDKQKIIVDNLEFHNQDGKIYAKGYLGDDRINNFDIDLDVTAQKYILYNRSDRKAILSGNAKLKFSKILGFSLVGNIKLDESNFSFPKSSMPSLGDDVVIIGANDDTINKKMPLYFDINIDLNKHFQFSGKGLSVIMGGNLHFISDPKSNMKLIGNVNVIKGNYKFYGQVLNIESGKFIFDGPISSPNINFKALRENSPVGAGIKVVGNLYKPNVELIANQSMSDSDKLSWLVLGRASSGETDDQALAVSMGMIVAGGINDKIKLLNDISIGDRQTRDTGTGELNPAEQIITLGRNITKKIYLGYEYGLTSTSQAAKIIYQISKSIQLITRAGTDSVSEEARYSVRFD